MNNYKQQYEEDTKTLNGKPKEIFYKGYKGLIIQHPSVGHLCGYVVIPEGHYLYEKHYDDIDLDVHGGLTYSGTNLALEDDFCIGFDCAHAGDWTPLLGIDDDIYKDISFVEKEIKHMIDQIEENKKESNAGTSDSKQN